MELSVKELRIGNLFNYGDGTKVVDINVMWSFESYYKNQLKPIPLTEQWLKDFGFIKKNDEYHLNIDRINRLCIQDDMSYCIEEISGMQSFVRFDDDFIKYVHQLQNIYFALTGAGKELIIKAKNIT